jgi:hypothetical protein
MQRWRETFASPVKQRTGRWVYRGFEWHAFSYGFCQARSGKHALSDYLAEPVDDIYVIPQEDRNVAFSCKSDRHIDFSACGIDLYVVPRDFSWTIAFTHEQPGIGPFFSRAEWCDGLGVQG